MIRRGLPIMLGSVLLLAAATRTCREEEYSALRGPALPLPLQTNSFRFIPPERQTTILGHIRYIAWKNRCTRVSPVIVGQPLVLPAPNYTQVAKYIVKDEPDVGYLHLLVESLIDSGR